MRRSGHWLHRRLGEGGDSFAALGAWGRDGAARTAAELIEGLEITWNVIHDAIDRWTPAEWEQIYPGQDPSEPQPITRPWVIWHLIEHDLHHGGEISLTLGLHGLTAPDV